MHNVFNEILNEVRKESDENSLARVIIEHNDLNDPIVVPLQELNSMDSSSVLDEIVKVLQSNESLSVDQSCKAIVGSIKLPSGSGGLRITKLTGENNSLDRKRSIINMSSKTMCMPVSIAICFVKSCLRI